MIENQKNIISKKEENIISKLTLIIPTMSEFNKGYLLGMIETLAYENFEKKGGNLANYLKNY